jgi:ribosome biogenesis protein Nip4
MRATWKRANTRNIQEVLANATEQLHQYHEMTAVPPELAYVPDVSAMHAGSVEAMCLFLFSVIAGYVQVRKRRKG